MTTTPDPETARLHDEILTLRAEVAQCRGLLRTENERANKAIDRETTAEEAEEEQRLALSQALGLGTGAPWDAIRDRVVELASAGPAPATDRAEVPDDIDVTEADVDRMMAEGVPVQIATAPPGTFTVDPNAPSLEFQCTPTDRAEQRDRIAAAVRSQTETGNVRYEAIADAVPAVLPAPVDPAVVRARALREARTINHPDIPLGHITPSHRTFGWCLHCPDRSPAEELAAWQTRELRRMADETPQPEGVAHSCPNCEGVDPATCLANPDRTTPPAAVAQPDKEA